MLNWHALTANETAEYLTTDPETGLSEEQAALRLEKHGVNLSADRRRASYLSLLMRRLLEPMSAAVLSAAVVAAVVAVNDDKGGNWLEPILIVLLVTVTGALRALRDHTAARTFAMQEELTRPRTRVLRDGIADTIPAQRLVPGDVILLEAGDVVPADARLLDALELCCDESQAESGLAEAQKSADTLTDATAPVDKRINMIYSGCPVISGSCKAIVTATGATASAGRSATLLTGGADSALPVPGLPSGAAQIWRIGVAVAVGAFVLFAGLARRSHDLKAIELIVTSIALSYATLPTGMQSVLSLVFSRGSLIMARQGVVTRKLDAVPSIGGVSVVCSGKTGILTQGRMSVERIWTPGGRLLSLDGAELRGEAERRLLEYAALCSDDVADALGGSIIASLSACGVDCARLDAAYPRAARLPYGFGRRLMTTVHRTEGGYISITKGAPEELLPLCGFCDADSATAVCEQMSRDCLRVLAVAYRRQEELSDRPTPDELERDLVFAGLVGISDAYRSDSAEAVAELGQAGIRVVMSSGEHPLTAAACAEELDILTTGDEVLTGVQLAQLSDTELRAHVRQFAVCARVSAQDKLRIIKAWQDAGETVLTTAVRVEDAPLIRAADASCSPGVTGRQTVCQSADIILSDDSFSLIADAVRLCRAMGENSRAAARTLLAISMGELAGVIICTLLFGTTPLLAVHMLAALVFGGAPLTAFLAYEPPDVNVMLRKPRRKKLCIPPRETAVLAASCAVVIAAATVAAYAIGKPGNVDAGRTMAFCTLCITQVLCSVCLRSEQMLIYTGLRSNLRHSVAALVSILCVVLITLFAGKAFLLVPLSFGQWLWIMGLSVASLGVFELGKLLRPLIRQLFGLPEQ